MLDTTLRNRLTGAIILIVIAVALLPELLTGAGSKSRPLMSDDHSRDGPPVVSYNIDLTGNAPRPASAESESAPIAAAEAAPPPPPVNAAPAPQTAPPAAVKAAPPVKTEPPVKSEPSAKPEPSTKTEGKLLVQVGSFKDRKAADARAKSLRVRNFDVTVVSNGAQPPLFRVRVGPAGDRAAAEKTLKRLKVVKVDGSIVPAN